VARERVSTGGGGEPAMLALQEASEQQQDLLMYISDVLGLENPALSEALAERMLQYVLFPVLLGSLITHRVDHVEGIGSSQLLLAPANVRVAKDRLSPSCALYLLHQVFDAFSQARALLQPLVAVLLLPRLPATLLEHCAGPAPPSPATYKATTADVSGPASAEAAAVGPLDDGAPASPGSLGLCALVEHVLQNPSAEMGMDNSRPPDKGEETCSVRAHFLAQLQSSSDTCVLLVAGVIYACIACGRMLTPGLLERAGLWPRQSQVVEKDMPASLTSEVVCKFPTPPGSEYGAKIEEVESVADSPFELLLLVVRALERHSALRVVVIQALVHLASNLTLGLEVQRHAEFKVTLRDAVGRALRSAARHVRSYLHGSLKDSFLDVFAEEWELHCAPHAGIKEASSNIRCLIPPANGPAPGCTAEWTFPASHSERQHAAKAIQCLLLLRRFQAELLLQVESDASAAALVPEVTLPDPAVRLAPEVTQPRGSGDASPSRVARAGSDARVTATGQSVSSSIVAAFPGSGGGIGSPLYILEEVADGYREQMAIELGRQDRIVCAVATKEGRRTQYLVLHPFLLLLVQPDLVSPGWAIVRTLAPVRVVESQVDRADSRTLRLGVRLARGAPGPSESSAYDPTTGAEAGSWLSADEHRGSSLYTLTLSFEDTKRCHCADLHLSNRRKEVRAQLRRRLEAFVDGFCS